MVTLGRILRLRRTAFKNFPRALTIMFLSATLILPPGSHRMRLLNGYQAESDGETSLSRRRPG